MAEVIAISQLLREKPRISRRFPGRSQHAVQRRSNKIAGFASPMPTEKTAFDRFLTERTIGNST